MKHKFQTPISQLNKPFNKSKRKRKKLQYKFQRNKIIKLNLLQHKTLVLKWYKLDQSSRLIKFQQLHLLNENKTLVSQLELPKSCFNKQDLYSRDKHYK